MPRRFPYFACAGRESIRVFSRGQTAEFLMQEQSTRQPMISGGLDGYTGFAFAMDEMLRWNDCTDDGAPYETRTRVPAVRGRCPGPLDEGSVILRGALV